jgi:hypothetical protein
MCNVPINMTIAERAIWGRTFYDMNKRSMGELLREAALKGLEAMQAEAAAQIKVVREERLRIVRATACLIAGLLVVVAAFGGADVRRSRRSRDEFSANLSEFIEQEAA